MSNGQVLISHRQFLIIGVLSGNGISNKKIPDEKITGNYYYFICTNNQYVFELVANYQQCTI